MKTDTLTGFAASAGALALSTLIASGGASNADPVDLAFFTHLAAEMPEQDVFVTKDDGAVYRVTAEDTDMQASLFSVAGELHHNPFDPAQVGPHAKGNDLGIRLGSWLGASGAGSYSCEGESGDIDIAFAGLVPEGVYTMWHFFMPMPVTDPFIGTLDLPYGARDGSDATFIAEKDGTANFTRTVDSCLQFSGSQMMAGLAIAYHSDGLTYGPLPGEFGKNSHIQLMTMLPK